MNDINIPGAKPFFPSRVMGPRDWREYFAFGHTQDLLSSMCTDTTKPCVLTTGLGGMEAIFYTVYRNLDPEFPGRFSGATFFVNEEWSLVQARSILMLYLCAKLPEKTEGMEARECLASIWAISYCLELQPQHVQVLKDALRGLLKFSATPKAWTLPENPLAGLVKFSNAHSFQVIVSHWAQWKENLGKEGGESILGGIRENRRETIELWYKLPLKEHVDKECTGMTENLLGLPFGASSGSRVTKLSAGLRAYLESGTVFAESTFNLPLPPSNKTQVNVTFYEIMPTSNSCSPFYDLVPFPFFFYSFIYSPKECRAANISRALSEKLPVKDAKFKESLLMANTLQQLAQWLAATARVLQGKPSAAKTVPKISFVFDCSNPINMLLDMRSHPEPYRNALGTPLLFDVMQTFHTVNHTSGSDLILHSIPLLQPKGLLFISLACLSKSMGSPNQMLERLLGTHPRNFGTLYGLRCIGMDAIHGDPINPRNMPWNFPRDSVKADRSRIIILQRQVCTPLRMTHLSDMPFVAKALHLVTLGATSVFPKSPETNLACSETILNCILTFISQLDSDCPTENPYFWEPYVQLLKEEQDVQNYLQQLQVSALIHNVHLHLTVDETSCPICQGTPLSSYLGQFTMCIPSPGIHSPDIVFGYVHEFETDINELGKLSHTCHCITSFHLRSDEDGKQSVDFYFPKEFVKRDYFLTVVNFVPTLELRPDLIRFLPTEICRLKLSSILVEDLQYSFLFAGPRSTAPRTSFGRTMRHVVTSAEGHTTFSLTSDLLESIDMKKTPLEIVPISQREMELVCRQHKISITFPFPVNFHQADVEVRYKDKTAHVNSPRLKLNFYDEIPLIIKTPSNRLFYPAVNFLKRVTGNYLGMQFTSPERQSLSIQQHALFTSPMIHLKQIFNLLFEQAAIARYLHICFKDHGLSYIQALLVVHDIVLDVETKSPAIDLSYCFLEDHEQPSVSAAWRKLTTGNRMSSLCISAADYGNLKNLFAFFASRTISVFSNNSRTSQGLVPVLNKHRVYKAFTRAIVYPLYSDPDLEGEINKDIGSVSRGLLSHNDVEYLMEKIGPRLAGESASGLYNLVLDQSTDTGFALRKFDIDVGEYGTATAITITNEREMGVEEKERVLEGIKEGMKVGLSEASSHILEHVTAAKNAASAENISVNVEKTSDNAEKTQDSSETPPSTVEQMSSTDAIDGESTSKNTEKSPTSSPEGSTTSESSAHSGKGKCSHCGKSCEQMKKCAACGKVRYCSRECQRLHWKEHKPTCSTSITDAKPQTQKTKTKKKTEKKATEKEKAAEKQEDERVVTIRPYASDLTRCLTCGMERLDLKRCTCSRAAYCNTLCQRLDWPNHKPTCSADKSRAHK